MIMENFVHIVLSIWLLLLHFAEPFYTSDPIVTVQLRDRSSRYENIRGNMSQIFPNIEELFKIDGEKIVSL